MKIALFSAKPYDRLSFDAANASHHYELVYLDTRLNATTAPLAADHPVVCVFANDVLDADTLAILAENGTYLVALRCAGYNNVDLAAAAACQIKVVRVPNGSPYAVAEHAVALLMTLNRKTHRAWNRVREANFSLDGLQGFDIHGLTVGIIGTGRTGIAFARIMNGFGCELLAHDPVPHPDSEKTGIRYVELQELFALSDIVSLHCPLTPATHHMINTAAIQLMKPGVTILNTSRGAVIDTAAVINGLKSGHIGNLGLDVYEAEADLFFEDLSSVVIQDDTFARLLSLPNVLITGHQAFFTRNALKNIAETTLNNIDDIRMSGKCNNQVQA
jgi:D-lactate dehydrogenase